MKKITGIFCFFLIVLGISNFSLAAGQSGTVAVENISIKVNGDIFVKTATEHANPDSCANGARWAVIQGDNPYKKEFLATTLTAISGGAQVSFYFGGCVTIQNLEYPVVNSMFIFSN